MPGSFQTLNDSVQQANLTGGKQRKQVLKAEREVLEHHLLFPRDGDFPFGRRFEHDDLSWKKGLCLTKPCAPADAFLWENKAEVLVMVESLFLTRSEADALQRKMVCREHIKVPHLNRPVVYGDDTPVNVVSASVLRPAGNRLQINTHRNDVAYPGRHPSRTASCVIMNPFLLLTGCPWSAVCRRASRHSVPVNSQAKLNLTNQHCFRLPFGTATCLFQDGGFKALTGRCSIRTPDRYEPPNGWISATRNTRLASLRSGVLIAIPGTFLSAGGIFVGSKSKSEPERAVCRAIARENGNRVPSGLMDNYQALAS